MDNRYKGLGITSMVLGIASILLCWTVLLSGLCAAVGAALGIYYLSKTRQERGFAIAGIVTSAVGIIVSIILILVVIVTGVVGMTQTTLEDEGMPYYEEQEPYEDFFDDYGDFFDDYNDFLYDGGEDNYTDSF